MRIRDSVSPTPISVEKSVRGDEIRVLTSARAGKSIPVAFSPILREDRVTRGSIRIQFDMEETVRPLMNAVHVQAMAHFIPFTAFERFNGSMDAFNRSYKMVNEPGGTAPIPFFTQIPYIREHEFWRSLGVHHVYGAPINAAPLEAYNVLVNYRRKVRSDHLRQRDLLDPTLAQAFWKNPRFAHIKPDFDSAMMDGEVPLSLNMPSTASQLQLSGLSLSGGSAGSLDSVHWANVGPEGGSVVMDTNPDGTPNLSVALPNIFAELASNGIAISLANIEVFKKTVAFAKLRDQFTGIDDDHIVDMLMDGISVPDEHLKQPMLLDSKSTIFGYSERHATDGDNLAKSVTTGKTELTLNFRTPPLSTGGIILITAEIVPEQLFERQRDNFLSMDGPDHLPAFIRDFLDPEKVETVRNGMIDSNHVEPTGTFGYAPLNWHWRRSLSRIGGRFHRPIVDDFIEDRQRIWSPEPNDIRLNEDFYLCPADLSHSVFADTLAEPFEILALGSLEIVGNTVFGPQLFEDDGNYDAVVSQVDLARINQESQAGYRPSVPYVPERPGEI